jgi:hypothetical protein
MANRKKININDRAQENVSRNVAAQHSLSLPLFSSLGCLLLAQFTHIVKSRSRIQWCFFPSPTLMRTLLLMQTNTTLHNLQGLFIFQLAGTC